MVIAAVFVLASFLPRKPSGKHRMAIMLGGAGVASLSGGVFGVWECVR
jgi:hypothetical protein